MKIRKKHIIISLVIIAVLIAVYFFISNRNDQELILEKVIKGTVIKEVSETGTVKASEEANLSFKSAGRIQDIYVEVGDFVKQGQVLARLDATDLSIQLNEAKAALLVAQAKETDAQVSLESARQELTDAEATAKEDLDNAYEDALASLDDAKLKLYNANNVVVSIGRDYFTSNDQEGVIVETQKNKIKTSLDNTEYYVNLAKSGSRDDIDTALSKVKDSLLSAKDALEAVRAATETISYRNAVASADKTLLDNHKSYINTVYTDIVNARQAISTTKVSNEADINSAVSTVSSLEAQLRGLYPAQVSQAQASISLLENQIEEAVLRSPVNGQVTKVERRKGETVSAAQTAVSILPSAPFKVEVDIYEEDIVNVKVGNPVRINLVAFPNNVFYGNVVSVDPSEKLIDGVVYYEANINFREVKEGIKIGMTADIIIETDKRENVIVVSKEAIRKINGKVVADIFESGVIKEREIKTGLEGGDFIEVVSGLNEGEEIVIR